VDGNGDQLTLYEISERGAFFGFFRRKRLVLGTGEAVARSPDGYIVLATGERLAPVGDS